VTLVEGIVIVKAVSMNKVVACTFSSAAFVVGHGNLNNISVSIFEVFEV